MSDIIVEPPHTNSALHVFRTFQDWAQTGITTDLAAFFRSLSHNLRSVFQAQLVTIWDNNYQSKCLALLASVPERHSVLASHTIPVEMSTTGIAVEKRAVAFHSDIRKMESGRRFFNPVIIDDLRLQSMISIPVFSMSDPEKVILVVNVCFDRHRQLESILPQEDLERLAASLGRNFEYLLYRRDEEIRNTVQITASTATGISSLFEGVLDEFQRLTQSTDATLFSWDDKAQQLTPEGSTNAKTTTVDKNPKAGEEADTLLITECVDKKLPITLREESPLKAPLDAEEIEVQCRYMAIPLLSTTNKVIGVIRCRDPRHDEKKSPSFSSLDLRALDTFSRAMSPSIERFLRVREGGVLEVIQNVSNVLAQAYHLDTSLQNTIKTLATAMHSEYASIYLRDEKSESFVLVAATDESKHLVGKAIYSEGEGLTGTIGTGTLINLKTKQEVQSHPSRLGKYHDQVWGENPDLDSDTMLGVPIIASNHVVGIWKIENVTKTVTHPDGYYTDEDVQVAHVLSSLLAYAIQNYRQEQNRLKQFTRLAKTSLEIEQAPNEDEALLSVLIALEEARFAGALVSLYQTSTKTLCAVVASGTKWKHVLDKRTCLLEDDDIRCVVLKSNQDMFIVDSGLDFRTKEDASDLLRVRSQFVLPLRFNDELIGTLQVDLGNRRTIQDDEKLLLRAFASHLAIAISRLRSVRQAFGLTNQIMASSRFLTAETLSAMAVHSLNHKLREIIKELDQDLKHQDIRQNEMLLKTFKGWRKNLIKLESELKKILQFVRAPFDELDSKSRDLHVDIQATIDTWFSYILSNNCRISRSLDAQNSVCTIPSHAFREILSVLFVNSVQAHAKRIDVKTYNEVDVMTPSRNVISAALCVESTDDGLGLSEKQSDEIFEPTYTTKNANEGTGLGLFVARRLARNAGGDLEIVDRPQSKGATFRLILPLAEE